MTVQHADQLTFADEWERWHREHETALAAPHGFLAITSINWLTAEPQRFADAPGSWQTGPGGPSVSLGADEELVVDGARARDRHWFGALQERGGIFPVSGTAVIEVARRGGYDIVRPRHPEHPLRVNFAGVPAYEPSPDWAITGRYVLFPEPRPTAVGSVVDDLVHVYEAPGYVDFGIAGQQYQLTAFPGRVPGSLHILFTDGTSGVTTYGASRSLAVDAPAEDGAVTLDFNRAVNLPCAFTDYATCPLPPAENALPVAVAAGEKLPYERAR